MNNKQIMYDCDKGYILSERGPVGATCVGGLWRPTELPECLPGLHPRLRWARKKRNVGLHLQKKLPYSRNFRQFRSNMKNLIKHEANNPLHNQVKNDLVYDGRYEKELNYPKSLIDNKNRRINAQTMLRFKRAFHRKRFPEFEYQFSRSLRMENNDEEDEEDDITEQRHQAYSKFYQKIKQKHRKYIHNLLRSLHGNRMRPFDTNGDGYNSEEKPENQNAHSTDESYKTPTKDPFDEINAFEFVPIPLPNINDNPNVYSKKRVQKNTTQKHRSNDVRFPMKKFYLNHAVTNATELMELLRSNMKPFKQNDKLNHLNNNMVRAKRSPNEDFKQLSFMLQNDDENRDTDHETPKKLRTKEPCEVSAISFAYRTIIALLIFKNCNFQPILMRPYLRIDILREGRDSSVEFSSGTIVRATCAKEYRLNLQNPNGTAKCVRGRWKPLKPECSLIPCSIASTEHGTYVALIPSNDEKEKITKQPLNAFDEVQNGETVQFSCDEGYNVQGSKQLKCVESSWDVPHLPECVPSPCSLPTINNAVYQGGYRAGLTIAHGSSVSVQCEGSTTPIQMGILRNQH